MREIEDKVKEILVDVCGTKKVKKDLDINLFTAGYLDSMGVVEFLAEVEDLLDVVIPLEKINRDDLNTGNKIITFIKSIIDERVDMG